MKNICIIIIVSVFSISLHAQEILSLNDAVNIALRNNYQIVITRNSNEIADNNLNIGNAGFLPTIDVSAGQSLSINNSDKTYQNGNISVVDGAEANVFTANASLDWTFFDGLKMFRTYSQLSEIKAMSDAELSYNIQSVVFNVMQKYYNIVGQQNLIELSKDNLAVSAERLRIMNEKLNAGSASRLDLLNAQVDYNTDYSYLANQEQTHHNLKVELNELLAREKETDFDVEKTVTLSLNITKDSLEKHLLGYNPELLIAAKNIELQKINSQIYSADYYPRLGFSADYNYINAKDNAGFLSRNINSGFSFGLNFTMNLFNGLNTSRRIENSKVEEQSAVADYERIKNSLLSRFAKVYHSYKKNVELSAMEMLNLQVANENFNISKEKLNIGKFSQLEMREAQKNLLAAQSRHIQTLNAAKLNEIEIMLLCGLITGK